jgi:short-subunit dehydrogenase
VVLLTGASSGLGAALARILAAPGRRLHLGGRDERRLEATAAACTAAGADVVPQRLDVRDRAALRGWVRQADADLVIANAGISGRDAEDARSAEIVAVNVQGVIDTVEAAWPAMAARRGGQIALMGSLAGFRGMPGAPVYSASKAAVLAYGQALRPHARRAGIALTVICPGFVATPMTAGNPFPMPLLMPAERAADIIARGLARRRRLILFPWSLALAARAIALLPDPLAEALLGRLPSKE